jgi:hypothetical protein
MRTVTTAVLVAAGAAAAAALLTAPATATAAGDARVHVVLGLPGTSTDLALDGRAVAEGVAGGDVAGPFDLAPGEHALQVTDGGRAVASGTLDLAAGTDQDVVVHLPAAPGGDALVTVFDNDLSPVPVGKARLVVTHTAAVPPADIVVDGEVLFANVANGESLTAVVPVGTYRVQVVPTGRTSPSLLGPLDLTVREGALNRVFAVGDPAGTGMDAVVHVLAVPTSGSPAPGRVDTGTGGQAAWAGGVGPGWFGRSG